MNDLNLNVKYLVYIKKKYLLIDNSYFFKTVLFFFFDFNEKWEFFP